MNYPLFEQLKMFYAKHPDLLDSLTRAEFENLVSCEKEENEYGSSIIRVNHHSGNFGAVCI